MQPQDSYTTPGAAPAIRLTGRYGRASNELDNLLKDSFDVWSLLGNITAPIFQGGQLRANVDRSDARMKEAVANYRDTVLTAFREVESALSSETYLLEQLEALRVCAKKDQFAALVEGQDLVALPGHAPVLAKRLAPPFRFSSL